MARCVSLLFFLLFLARPSQAIYTYQYTASCQTAYTAFMSLQPENGQAAIQKALRENPSNLLATYIADYDDFLTLFINGDKNEFNKRKANYEKRLDQLDNGDENDPYYRLCKAGLHLHWAIIYARFDEKLKAAAIFRKSFVLMKDNAKKFPSFSQNNVLVGLQESMAGAIPEDYKWIASVIGIKGDVRNGIVKLVNFLKANPTQGSFMRSEALIFYAYLKFYLQTQQDAVWTFVSNQSNMPTQNNLMNCFVKANIALNFRKADVALQTLQYAQTLPGYSSYPSLDFEMGNALLMKLDTNCIRYFEKFIHNSPGAMYVKDAWRCLSYIHLLQKDFNRATHARAQILKPGNTISDADKQAERFAATNKWPEPSLLRARLLFDGGYYQKALNELTTYNEAAYRDVADRAEYNFRMGRIYDELNQEGKAIQYYQLAINLGKGRKEHFAARSALQQAFIYEKLGQTDEAIKRFRICLSMRDHDFQSSIDQQAKAGLNRLGAD